MAMKLIKKEELTENGVVYIKETYQSDKTGKESVVKYPKPSDIPKEPEVPQPTQLDRIEEQLNALTADSVTLANVEMAIEEGVNEV